MSIESLTNKALRIYCADEMPLGFVHRDRMRKVVAMILNYREERNDDRCAFRLSSAHPHCGVTRDHHALYMSEHEGQPWVHQFKDRSERYTDEWLEHDARHLADGEEGTPEFRREFGQRVLGLLQSL